MNCRCFGWIPPGKVFLAVVFIVWLLPRAHATDYDVYIDDIEFTPDYLEVQIGDTVYWWNIDIFGDDHSTHSFTYAWDSGPIAYLHGVHLKVDRTGTFAYRDDYTGATATLVVKPAVVQPPPPILTDPARLPNGTFQFTVTNLVAGKTSVIEASTNLVDWTGISTNLASADNYLFQDPDSAGLSRRFYRVLALP